MSAKHCLRLDVYTPRRIPECALAAEAEAIVTEDRAMSTIEEFRGLRILSPGASPADAASPSGRVSGRGRGRFRGR